LAITSPGTVAIPADVPVETVSHPTRPFSICAR
jgi:hypothetical protein